MVEYEKFRVEVNIKGTSKRVLLSTPKGLDLVAAARAFKGFSRDAGVQEKLSELDDDCEVKMYAIKNEIIGITVYDCNEEKV